MAQHVQEASVFERRLRPIYDSLEVGNNKKALQEVEKLLKKNPTLTCAYGLKALALFRLGKEDESNNTLNTISLDKTADDATLQVLSFCYKEMEQLEKICELYNHAAKQFQGNEEILAHLFISYVRLDNYKAQQAAALQLYKAAPKNPYYYWAVMSVVLQGIRGPESSNPEKRKLYLALSQKMIDKMINENKIDGEQEVQLYLQILEAEEKYEEALEFLEGPVCQKHYPGAPVSIKINLLKITGKWFQLNILLKELLKEDHDRWDYYQDYLTSVFELYIKNTNEDNSNSFENCHEFLCQLIESDGKKVRGPYLARLELHKRMREKKLNTNDILGNFIDLITEYYKLFGDKSCCTHDITLFLKSISETDRLDLATKLLKESGVTSTSLPQTKEQMQKHICALQISRICGTSLDMKTDHLLAFYTALRLHYENGLNSFGKNLLPTDLGPSDPYVLLAANVMYDVSILENKSEHLLEALCLLQYVFKNSPSNFHVKLLCLKIYHFFGCAIGAQIMYESLDIKHVQLDSMGYLHCALLANYGLIGIRKNIYDLTLKFFTNSYKERLEYIAMSYKFGSFSKLEEFMDFRDRLSNSLHYAAISADELLLELICISGTTSHNLNTFKLMSIKPEEDRVNWHELADNRDFSVIVRWDPIHLIDKTAEINESFTQDIEALKIRSLLLRLIASFVDLLHFPDKTNTEESYCIGIKELETINFLKEHWIDLFQQINLKKHEKSSSKFLVNLLPSRLHLMLEIPYVNFFNYLAQFTIDLYNGKANDKIIMELNEIVNNIYDNFCKKAIDDYNTTIDNIWLNRETNHKIFSVIEIFALYAFVLSVCHEKYSQITQNVQTKKNRRKDSKSQEMIQNSIENANTKLNDKERLQIIVGLMRNLKKNLQNCSEAINLWKSPQIPENLSDCMNGMSLNPKTEEVLLSDIIDVFKENHVKVVNELRNIIKDKIRMINK